MKRIRHKAALSFFILPHPYVLLNMTSPYTIALVRFPNLTNVQVIVGLL